jgi:hypothetical protein
VSPVEELTAIARRFGQLDVLEVCREALPPTDYEEILSRLRARRMGGGSSPSVEPAVAARNQQPFGERSDTAEV